ncbi:expressed protein [Phakopsora pachyrhizi]|uniref:Expressed protein n=1 Tax=Phakopsora pachyrhizi TaxID=170000 RepID=A0AAV0BCW7_PHAPC|nr:expressed protein [Phakopsora pachyrhizi]
MVKIILQSFLVTICLLNLSVKTLEWAELTEVLDQAQEASTAGTLALEDYDHFETKIVTQSIETNDKSFKEELQLILDRIKYFRFGEQINLKNKLNGIKDLIEKVLKDPEEYNNGEIKSFGAKDLWENPRPFNIRLKEILDEVKKCLFEFYMTPNKLWEFGSHDKSAVMSGILRVLDPLIKHGFLDTDQTRLFFNDSDILRISAYVLSEDLPLNSRYFLPSIEALTNVSGKEYAWLSMLTEPKIEFFLRHLIGFFYTNYTYKITHPKFLPIVNFFLGDSAVTDDIFISLFKIIEYSEQYHRRLDHEIEAKSNFVNQALTYVQKYAPTEVKRIYTESNYDIFWKKKELLDIICQLMPISRVYKNEVEKFLRNRFGRSTTGKDHVDDTDIYYKFENLKRALKALNYAEDVLRNRKEKISEDTIKKLSAVDRTTLKKAFDFKAAVAQLFNSVKSTPAGWAKDIYDWLELPNQNELLNLFRGRAFLLNEEIETLGNLKNQLLVST